MMSWSVLKNMALCYVVVNAASTVVFHCGCNITKHAACTDARMVHMNVAVVAACKHIVPELVPELAPVQYCILLFQH